MQNKIITALLCLALTSVSLAQVKPAGAAVLPAVKIEKIDAAARAWMLERKAPALSVVIVQDNKVVYEKGYGLADLNAFCEELLPKLGDTE